MAKTKTKDHTKYVFVRTKHDWADEFDVECCFVTTKEAYERDLAAIKAKFASGDLAGVEIYFGTNECFQFERVERLTDGITVQECSAEFANEFGKLNDRAEVGFNIFDAYLNYDPNY